MRKLNYLQLAYITGSALGVPGMIIGGVLAKELGTGIALSSIFIGNLLLWLIGLAIIFMSDFKNHALENVQGYLGKPAALLASIILGIAFLVWYAIQIQEVTSAIHFAIHTQADWAIGVGLGLLITCVSLGGIRSLNAICRISLPLLLAISVYVIFTSKQGILLPTHWGISLIGIVSVIFTWLPYTINLPTFFCHAKTRSDTVLGLSVMSCLHMFFQSSLVFADVYEFKMLFLNYSGSNNLINNSVVLMFFFMSFFCVNLINIYFASACWATLFPKCRPVTGYLLTGFFGTCIYLVQQGFTVLETVSFPAEWWTSILATPIAILGIVLLVDFLIRRIAKHRPRPWGRFWSSFSWFAGSVVATAMQLFVTSSSNVPLISGLCTSLFIFLVVIFVEETIWSVKTLN